MTISKDSLNELFEKLETALLQEGLKRAQENCAAYTLSGMDVSPFYAPKLSVRHGAVWVDGEIGVHVEPFEVFWRRMLEGLNITDDQFAMAILVSNIEEIRELPNFTYRRLSALTNTIVGVLNRLPKSPDALVRALTVPGARMLGWECWAFMAHPLKADCLLRWIEVHWSMAELPRPNLALLSPDDPLWPAHRAVVMALTN